MTNLTDDDFNKIIELLEELNIANENEWDFHDPEIDKMIKKIKERDRLEY